MRHLFYIVAFIFIIGWLVGVLGFHTGGAFHLLLVVAIVAALLGLMQEKTVH
ncbi:lmo0937 family membrane protein [Niastella caeni]|uniref:Lmo0937 family membrane protein n=1 Tax=Niastella caeni TaxID=2569763 RepID=A0A4S8I355_9BACT|nr:lmo0937 family membrane protein [Niastella caeni]THU40462.1 lmo0937 family membrane protein [Niastella caeni]